MNKTTKLRLYRATWIVTVGYVWQYCRDVTQETKLQWLEVFQKEEPSAKFAIMQSKNEKDIKRKPTAEEIC